MKQLFTSGNFKKALSLLFTMLVVAALIVAVYSAACGLTWSWRYVVEVTTMKEPGILRWGQAIFLIVSIPVVLLGIALTAYKSIYKNPNANNNIFNNIGESFATVMIAVSIVGLIYLVYGIGRALEWTYSMVVLTLTQDASWFPTVMAWGGVVFLICVAIGVPVVLLAIALTIYDNKHKGPTEKK